MTRAQQEQAIMLIRQGMPLQKVAELFEVSYETMRRLVRSQGIVLRRGERKLTPEQLAEAYDLLRKDVPFRQVAKQFDVHPESLRRLAEQDGIALRARGEKSTPTQRKLTQDEQQEACALVESGASIRQTAKRFGISRQALVGMLKKAVSRKQ
ncbi:MAG TPA: helix-turn-helix domain-containing protein [Ktedonobacteraceae bacterium]